MMVLVLSLPILIGIYILYFLIWVKKTVVGWLFFKFQGRKILTENLLGRLNQFHYPEPDDYIESGFDYLVSMVVDETANVNARINAASILGEFTDQKNNGNMQNYLRANIALDNALQSYKSGFMAKSKAIAADLDPVESDANFGNLSKEEEDELVAKVFQIKARCDLLDTDAENFSLSSAA